MIKRNKGFTLIELLVVIAIIGILSSVVLASLNSAREKSRDAKRVSDIKQLQLALELYFDTNSSYPDLLSDLKDAGFIAQTPTDPLGNTPYAYNAYTTSAVPPLATDDCNEALPETCVFYHLGASLENATAATDSDVDAVGDIVNGDDGSGCAGTDTTRVCYDVTP